MATVTHPSEKKSSISKQPTSPQKTPQPTLAPPDAPLTFLIVDDQPTARKMLRQVIANIPAWQVAGEAESGLDALDKLDIRPDVVVMDIVMPDINGLMVTREIKTHAHKTIVILTTAYQNHEFKRRSLQAGADGFLLKDDLTTETLKDIVLHAKINVG
jgi:DNA-binding NarL/FixJ family response regulator